MIAFQCKVVFGGGNYSALLPPKSFVDARQFSSPRGQHLLTLQFKDITIFIYRLGMRVPHTQIINWQFQQNLLGILARFWQAPLFGIHTSTGAHTMILPGKHKSIKDFQRTSYIPYDITRQASFSKVSNTPLCPVLPRCRTIVLCATSSWAGSLGSPTSMRISSHGWSGARTTSNLTWLGGLW